MPRFCAPLTPHACERVARWHGKHERNRHHDNADESRVGEPLQILRIAEQNLQMMQGRRVMKQIRIESRVVEVVRAF